jgi:hypothetical protein
MDSDPNDPPRWSVPWWLARLTFSFFIVAFLCLYEANRSQQRGDTMRATIFVVAAAAGIVLGITGMRSRHRR